MTTLRELAPWRWGGLRQWQPEEKPFESFRREMETIQRDMDRLLGDFWRGEYRWPEYRWPEYREDWGDGGFAVNLNETEDDKAYHITVELPGMDEKDVDLTLTDGVLTIRGEKKEEAEEKGKEYFRKERTFGAFRRALKLPVAVDESKIEASFKRGVLTIELPKTAEAQQKVKHISVKAA